MNNKKGAIMGEAKRKLESVDNKPSRDTSKKPTANMATELGRLFGNVSIAQQQFNEFVVYCRKETGLPEGWRLDVQKMVFVPPEQKKEEPIKDNGNKVADPEKK